MNGIDPKQLREYVVRPVLRHLEERGEIPHTLVAEQLLIGTAAQESAGGRYLHQLGGGPAVGIFQMEPATHEDIWQNYLSARPRLAASIEELNLPTFYPGCDAREMAGNLYYAAAMTRIFYRRIPSPLPVAGDINAIARYWKQYYNTRYGRGTAAEFIRHFPTSILEDA